MITDFDPEITIAARTHGLDSDLVTAVVMQESSGRTNAYRYEPGVWNWFKGNPRANGLNKYRAAASYGLMQCLYATATDYGFATEPEYLFLPKVGLDMGCRHLAAMLKRHKTLALALEAYNGGSGNANGKGTDADYAVEVLMRLHNIRATRPPV